jgi:hypothetical protein
VSRNVSLPTLLSLTSLLFGSSLLAQSAWTRVPPLPRACYSGRDTFEADAEKVRTDLEAAIEAQEQVNRGLGDQLMNMDPATLNQRMMAAIQKDPARAQEIIQLTQSFAPGSAQHTAVMAAEAEDGEFRDRKARLTAEYDAGWKAVLGPIRQRTTYEDATVQSRAAAWAEFNRQYETVVCPRWFGKQVPDLLASYRAYLVERRIPKRAEAEATHVTSLEMFGVSTKAFRPIAEMRAVADYVRFASDLFGQRERTPGPPVAP